MTRETYNGVVLGEDYQADYTYDLVGNRLSKQTLAESGQVELITGTFNARDWLLSEETRVNGLLTDTATYGYDDNGSLTSRTNTNGDSLTQTWSLRNRLAGATVVRDSVTTNTSNLYDDSGIRVRTTENGTTRLFLIDGVTPAGYAQVVEEYSSGGILLASYVYGMEPLSQSQGGAVSHYLMDGHSGVRLILDPAAAILNRYRFDAYGVTQASSGVTMNSLLYRGERFDATLGQYYLRARFYGPRTGRFTTVDPYEGTLRSPLTLHKYLYTSADPLNRIDPSGRWSFMSSVMLGAAIGGTLGAFAGYAYGAHVTGSWALSWTNIKYAIVGLVGGAIAGAFIGGAAHVLVLGGWPLLQQVITKGFTAYIRKAGFEHSKTIAAGVAGFFLGFALGIYDPDFIVTGAGAFSAIALALDDAIIRAARFRIHPLIQVAVPFFVANAPRFLTYAQSGTYMGISFFVGFTIGHGLGSVVGRLLEREPK